jgi:hypothetical protein
MLYAAIFRFFASIRIARQPQKVKYEYSIIKNILSALSLKTPQSFPELYQLENINNKNLEILKKFFKHGLSRSFENGLSLEICDQRWNS